MSETKSATAELPGAIRRGSSSSSTSRGTLLVLALGLLISGLLTISTADIGSRLLRLQNDLAATRPETFNQGVMLRELMSEMDVALLRFQLTNDPEERDGFQERVRRVREMIREARDQSQPKVDPALIKDFEQTFEAYVSGTADWLGKGIKGIRKDTTAKLRAAIQEQSAPVKAVAERWVTSQRSAWAQLFERSTEAVAGVRRLWQGSLVLLLLVGAATLWVISRAFISPLRNQLDESRAIIERQEKLAALGTLAAGVAHEIRNPLTAMRLRLFSLQRALPPDFHDQDDLDVLKQELERLERIVKQFLLFARPAPPERTAVHVPELFADLLGLLRAQLGLRQVNLQVQPGSSGTVFADRSQLQQVMINLIQNGAESIAGHGSVTLSARSTSMVIGGASKAMVAIDIRDTGAGIPPEVQPRIFDPFFSTKEAGTGLGLAIAARIVQNHQGTLQFVSHPGAGTTFTLCLPVERTES